MHDYYFGAKFSLGQNSTLWGQNIEKSKFLLAEIFPDKKISCAIFSFNSGVDCIKLPVCDDTEDDDDSLDIGSLG